MFAPEMPEIMETVGLMQCHACGVELRERDKFCRRCGVSQRLRTAPQAVATDRSEYVTRLLPGAKHHSGSFSGTLVNLVMQGVTEGTSRHGANRWTMRLVGALVAVPLWMMIALLSPLDAYFAAKAIAKQC